MKHRHHYVWQAYLKSWEINNYVWCLRAGKIFPSNTLNIGQERDFYKISELSDRDLWFIKELTKNTHGGLLEEVHDGWIDIFQATFSIKHAMTSMGMPHDTIDDIVNNMATEFEENMHMLIESESKKYIDKLLIEDISFCKDDDNRVAFLYFLCLQFVRTKKAQESVIRNSSQLPEGVDMRRCISAFRHIFAINMAFTLFSRQDKYKFVIVRNNTGKSFITCDQPIINTYCIGLNDGDIPPETELYYPLSPYLALLVTSRYEYHLIKSLDADNEFVNKHNKAIFYMAFEQVYADNKKILEEFESGR